MIEIAEVATKGLGSKHKLLSFFSATTKLLTPSVGYQHLQLFYLELNILKSLIVLAEVHKQCIVVVV